jgi:hypothetical protein
VKVLVPKTLLQGKTEGGRMRSNRIALIATLLCLVGGVAAATAFAQKGSTKPATASSECQNNQQGVDEQGTANEINATADDVEQEADSQQGDDAQGDQQGPNDDNEQGDENCDDGGDEGGDNGGGD